MNWAKCCGATGRALNISAIVLSIASVALCITLVSTTHNTSISWTEVDATRTIGLPGFESETVRVLGDFAVNRYDFSIRYEESVEDNVETEDAKYEDCDFDACDECSTAGVVVLLSLATSMFLSLCAILALAERLRSGGFRSVTAMLLLGTACAQAVAALAWFSSCHKPLEDLLQHEIAINIGPSEVDLGIGFIICASGMLASGLAWLLALFAPDPPRPDHEASLRQVVVDEQPEKVPLGVVAYGDEAAALDEPEMEGGAAEASVAPGTAGVGDDEPAETAAAEEEAAPAEADGAVELTPGPVVAGEAMPASTEKPEEGAAEEAAPAAAEEAAPAAEEDAAIESSPSNESLVSSADSAKAAPGSNKSKKKKRKKKRR